MKLLHCCHAWFVRIFIFEILNELLQVFTIPGISTQFMHKRTQHRDLLRTIIYGGNGHAGALVPFKRVSC